VDFQIKHAMSSPIPFNKSSLQGRELEFIFQTITHGQIAGDVSGRGFWQS